MELQFNSLLVERSALNEVINDNFPFDQRSVAQNQKNKQISQTIQQSFINSLNNPESDLTAYKDFGGNRPASMSLVRGNTTSLGRGINELQREKTPLSCQINL